jgi:hypothetical protein
MTYNSAIHHRRSIRLKGYDYTRAGAYWITICTQGRLCLFREVVDGEMRLNEAGRIIDESWCWLQEQYDYVEFAEYVVITKGRISRLPFIKDSNTFSNVIKDDTIYNMLGFYL